MRRRTAPLALTGLAFVVAFAQSPGKTVADTKLSLYVDPGRFLTDVLSAWSPTTDLGHVWAGQYGGYVFPMAPWFALGHWLGLPMWVVAAAVARRACWRSPRGGWCGCSTRCSIARAGVAHLTAGALFIVNPYVAIYADRTSVALLAYAALPWLLLCVHRGLRDPRGWWWPAAFALVLTVDRRRGERRRDRLGAGRAGAARALRGRLGRGRRPGAVAGLLARRACARWS